MLLSIIIPCFNSEKYISSMLDMLIEQNLDDCEVIVINDGSTDDTFNICCRYASRYNNIRVIDKINEGVSVARNIGIEESRGEYIYFLDSDDYLEPNTLDFYRTVLNTNKEISFYAFGYYSKYNGKILTDYSYKMYDKQKIDAMMLKQSFFEKKLCFHICSCICEKDFLVNNQIKFTAGLKIGEDIEFLLKILSRAPNCLYYARHCFIYQIRDDSTMQGYKSYSVAQWNSFIVNFNLQSLFKEIDIEKSYNFFLANSYLSNLIYYLKSNSKSEEMNKNFIDFRSVLNRKISFGNLKRFIIIKILKLVPLSFLYRIFKKY